MRYVFKLKRIYHELKIVTPSRPFWGHCVLENRDLEEHVGFSCGITFRHSNWFDKYDRKFEVVFYWENLPVTHLPQNATFFSGSTRIFYGKICSSTDDLAHA